MKRNRLAFAGAVLLIVSLFLATLNLLTASADVSLCAWVVDTEAGDAVPGAQVVLLGLRGATWETLASGVTDSAGHVLLNYSGESPDRYALVKTNPSGYNSVSASGEGWTTISPDRVEAPPGALGCATFVVAAIQPPATATSTPRPTKTPGNTPTHTNTPLVSTIYTLCGKVVTTGGEPLVGWAVRLDWYNGTSWTRPVASGVTDGAGNFCLTTDTHGGPSEFMVVQQPVLPGWTPVDAHDLAGSGLVIDYTVYWVALGPPGTYNVVEFVRGQNTPTPTPPIPLSKVVGYVYEDLPEPVPLAGVTVRLYAVDGGMTELGSTLTDVFGYFEFEGQFAPGTLAAIEEDLPGFYSTRSDGGERWSVVNENRLHSDGEVPIWGCLYFYDLRQPTETPTSTSTPTQTPTPTSTPTDTPTPTATSTGTSEPTATPTPTQCPEYTFAGYAYEGSLGDRSSPLSGVLFRLYGSDNPSEEYGALLGVASTDATGTVEFTVAGPLTHDYYNLVAEDAGGYDFVGALVTAGTGVVKGDRWIQFTLPEICDFAGEFYFQAVSEPTATPTPTATGCPEYTFTGYAYEGSPGDHSTPLLNVMFWLYGSDSASAQYGAGLGADLTDASGRVAFTLPAPLAYAYYNLVVEEVVGYDFVGATVTAGTGTAKGSRWLQFTEPDVCQFEGEFYFEPVAEPTSTPTATPQPTGTGFPGEPTQTPTSLPTNTPTATTETPSDTATPTATSEPPGPTATSEPGTPIPTPKPPAPTPTPEGTPPRMPVTGGGALGAVFWLLVLPMLAAWALVRLSEPSEA